MHLTAKGAPRPSLEYIVPGIGLLSRNALSSALTGLTSEFGMGSGVSLSLETPETIHSKNAG